MSNQRKNTSSRPRKPRFPIETLPPEMAAMVRAVAKSEKTTVSQAAFAALIAVSDSMPPGVALDMGDGTTVPLDEPIDIEFLVPDPADRPGFRRAYAALIRAMPPEARRNAARCQQAREVAAGNMKSVSRADAVVQLAAHIRDRKAYVIAAGPVQVQSAVSRLGDIRQCAAYFDQGTDTVMTVTGPALSVMAEVIGVADFPVTGVLVVPKTVSAARLSRALANDIPADGSRDMITLTSQDGKMIAWPTLFVDAVEHVDPQAAQDIRIAERDYALAQRPPAVTALVDQAEAAARHGMGVLHAMASGGGGEVMYRPPPPVVRDIVAVFVERAQADDLDLCPHLSASSPVPAFWLPYAAELIRCVDCSNRKTTEVNGTPEDRTCDNCRRESDRIFPGAAQLPGIVADLPGLLAATGPLTVLYGLCPECHAVAYPERDAR